MKRGKEYHCCETEYSGKKGKGKQYNFPYFIKLLGRISSGEDGKGTKIMAKKI